MSEDRRSTREWGDLYPLLIRVLTKKDVDRLDVPKLAEKLEMSEEGVYKWLRSDTLPTRQARRLADMSKGRVTFDEFLPFIA